MAQCGAFKRNGERCTLPAKGENGFCWAHSPENAEQRRRTASKAGRSKASRAIKELHQLLEDLTQRVIDGKLETPRGAVANQLIQTRIKLLEFERKSHETDELAEELERIKREFRVS